MASTQITYINSPTASTTYAGGRGTECIPNSGTAITCEVRSFAGSNGGGGLVTVGTLTCIVRDVTAGVSRTTINGGPNVNTTTANSSMPNGTDIYDCWGSWSGSGSPGSISLQVTSYTGSPVLSLQVYRSGAWSSAQAVKVYRSGAWVNANAVYVYRSGTWVQVG